MARISIYVTDKLKALMDKADDAVNWSEVVRPAIQTALATHEHRKSPSMDTAIERLRASKLEAMQEDRAEGKRDGQEWARDTAEYRDLDRLSKQDGNDIDTLRHAIDPAGEMSEADSNQYLFGSEVFEPSDDYVAAFIAGALEFFKEVDDKL